MIISTVVCGRRRSSTWPPRSITRCRPPTPTCWPTGSSSVLHSGSLVRYLETFDHTIAVMQTAASLRRVAREFVEDLAADGVVYGETRWAPEQHIAAAD